MSEDLAWRRDALGSSDAPAILGIDPWRTPGDVWAEKTGRLPAVDQDDEPQAFGKALEPVLLTRAERRLRVPVARQVWYHHPDAPLACSVDGLALMADPPVLLEAKTCGLLNRPASLLAAYGDNETDEVPPSVLVQVTHQFVVLNAQPDLPPIQDALVCALLGDGRGFRFYWLRFDRDLGAELLEDERTFWERHVLEDRRPPDAPSLETLKRMTRRPELAAVPVDPDAVAAWLRAKQERDRAEKAEEALKRDVIAALGDAEAGVCALGTMTYRAVERKGYTVDPQTVRQFRFKATKGQELPL
jgi:predicted phage-related endonuclease